MHFWRTRIAPRAGVCRVGIAVSGGIDSSVLAFVVSKLKPHLKIRSIRLLHLDHGLRPAPERKKDLEVLRKLSRRIRVPLTTGRARVRNRGAGIESAARSARHAFFARQSRAFKLDAILLAHHLDDRIETFFLFLLRGSGARGLSSMRPVEQLPFTALRPLLPFTRAEIVRVARTERIDFHEDSTNADPRFLRNRIRLELIPLLKSIHPGFHKSLSSTIESLASESATMSEDEKNQRDSAESGSALIALLLAALIVAILWVSVFKKSEKTDDPAKNLRSVDSLQRNIETAKSAKESVNRRSSEMEKQLRDIED